MQNLKVAAVLGLALAGIAACSDSIATRLAAPTDSPRLSQNPYTGPGAGREKVTICHAAGRAGTTHYVEITVGAPAQYAHIDEHGTPQAGHEQDYYTTKGSGCGQQTSQPVVSKTLTRVFTMNGEEMVDDPNWSPGQPLTIPRGETRWLRFSVDYSLPEGTSGTITESHDGVCATAGPGMTCGFNTGGVFSWPVSGTGSVLVDIDLSNNSACDERTFTNTAVLTPAGGSPISAVAPVPLRLVCPTVTKTLSRVFIMSGNDMVDDPSWSPGRPVTIPRGETKWLRFTVNYSLPAGTSGAITENHDAVCGTAGDGMTCGFNTGGVFSWPAQGTGSVLVDIDLSNDTACGTRTFTNTAVFVPTTGSSTSATAPVPLQLTCD